MAASNSSIRPISPALRILEFYDPVFEGRGLIPARVLHQFMTELERSCELHTSIKKPDRSGQTREIANIVNATRPFPRALAYADATNLGPIMRIVKLESFLTNAGLRNYLFVRLTTDSGEDGIGEASLEWQEQTVQTLLHEWVEDRVLGRDPFDVERLSSELIRDQYQGGSTVLTAISGVEIACWDLIGKACGQPVYKLLGGRARERLPAYANGWYGGARTPGDYAEKALAVVQRGYTAMKFDPFSTAWKEMTQSEMNEAEEIVAAVREAVGDSVEL